MTNRATLIKQASVILVVGLAAFFVSFSLIKSQPASAADPNNWHAGEIIDDSVFYNGNDLSVDQIQQFLDQRIASVGGCDTNGLKTSELGGGTRAQYGASRGYPAPYTCINGYYESPTTHANNLSGNQIPSDGMSAAQIIKNAAITYNISARALLVIIQKESPGPLLTDAWPFPNQYTNALGYGCPDTAPCDPQYAGFMNQVNNAARQFQLYKNSPDSYRKKAQQSNDVLYNPLTTCGSSSVFISNNATAGLYNYTPYQPNQSALSNLYGSGDGCSAYGNRNFWRMFTDWFGNTIGPENFWGVDSVNIFSDAQHAQSVRTNGSEVFLNPGQKAYVQVVARNQGRTTWQTGTTRLGTYSPIDYTSSFVDSSWMAPFRIGTFSESTVAPSQTATFNFTITAPQLTSFYTERYNLLTEGVTWFNDANLRLYITVLKPDTSSVVPTVKYGTGVILNSTDSIISSDKHSVLKLQSDGNLDLLTNFTRTWSSNSYNSGGKQLILQSDGNLVLYNASNVAVWSSNTSLQDQTGLINRVLPNGLTLYPGQSLTTPDRNYSLNYQQDGNVVLYSPTKAIWSTNTYGKSLGSLGLQSDGNLVLVDRDGKITWTSQTGNKGYSNLLLQQDGNLVLYNYSNQAIWASNTSGAK
ncbi:MAG TPA: hypothetical protein VIM31_03590 [Candidatus Microsaccharimonas sp.]